MPLFILVENSPKMGKQIEPSAAAVTASDTGRIAESSDKVDDEKNVFVTERFDTSDSDAAPAYTKDIDGAEIYVPTDDEEFIDPRLKDYPVPLVAKTVDLHNDPT